MKEKIKTLCIVAGSSGGHILPGLAYAAKMKQYQKDVRVICITTKKDLDRKIVAQYEWVIHCPLAIKNYPGISFKLIPWMFSFKWAAFKSCYYLMRYRADFVMSMGGYISLPVWLAAKILRKPFEAYELNVVPGKAIKALARLRVVIRGCFDQTKQYLPARAKFILSTYPIRFNLSHRKSIEQAREFFNIPRESFVIFVVGGSQGSDFLNTLMKQIFERISAEGNISKKDLFIIHQTGVDAVARVKALYDQVGITAHVVSYLEHIENAFQAADCVVSRAGAGVLAELDYFKCKAALLPLHSLDTMHQYDNALQYVMRKPEQYALFDQKIIEREPLALCAWFEKLYIGKNSSIKG